MSITRMQHHSILRTVSANEQEQWDTFIAQQPSGHLLQSWGWGELKAGAGWHPLRLALWDAEQDEMVAAAQVLRRSAAHLPLRLGYLAYIPKGPVLAQSYREGPDRFLLELNRYLKGQGALASQIELPLEAEGKEGREVSRSLTTMGFHPVQAIQPARTIVLDLTLDEDRLLANMKEKWRYNVRLAGRKSVRVRAAETLEEVREWYKLLQTTSARDDFGIHTLDYYLRAWQIFVARKQAQLFLADHNGQLLAGIFVGLMAKQAIYLYGASSNEQRHLMPNYLLQWEAIRWAKSQGATSYDLWGIPETDDADEGTAQGTLAGVYRFKSGWGGRVVRFVGNYERVYRPLPMRIARRFLQGL